MPNRCWLTPLLLLFLVNEAISCWCGPSGSRKRVTFDTHVGSKYDEDIDDHKVLQSHARLVSILEMSEARINRLVARTTELNDQLNTLVAKQDNDDDNRRANLEKMVKASGKRGNLRAEKDFNTLVAKQDSRRMNLEELGEATEKLRNLQAGMQTLYDSTRNADKVDDVTMYMWSLITKLIRLMGDMQIATTNIPKLIQQLLIKLPFKGTQDISWYTYERAKDDCFERISKQIAKAMEVREEECASEKSNKAASNTARVTTV